MKKIVVETRERVYHDDDGYEIGRGKEIVKEISVCEAAYREYLKDHPELMPAFKTKKAQRVTSAYSAPLEITQPPIEEPPPTIRQPNNELSALEQHLQAVREGRLVPIEVGGEIKYVSPQEALNHARGR